MTSEADRALLLRLARDAIVAHVAGRPAPLGEEPPSLGLGGAFVTIQKNGELRGCVGHVEPDEPLAQVVIRCAISACSSDPRFEPVTMEELPYLAIELSLLGPLEPVGGSADIEIGRHGLVIEQGRHRGLLLPQVAVEWHWDSEAFLTHTCRKAGLSSDAWKRGATIWRFEAEVFAEEHARRTASSTSGLAAADERS